MNIGGRLFLVDGTTRVQHITDMLSKYCKKLYFYKAALFQVFLFAFFF